MSDDRHFAWQSSADPHAAAPSSSLNWKESVLSTRSLSYLSTADALATPPAQTQSTHSRSASTAYFNQPMRTIADEHEPRDVDMDETSHTLSDVPELPHSVVNCALFRLPREIRDKVYSYCLSAENGQPIEWPRSAVAGLRYAIYPQILRTCRIILEESAPVLYSANHLTFHHPSDANMFVRAIACTALARQYIYQLSLHIKPGDNRLWMPYLTSKADNLRSLSADFPHLRELDIRYRSNRWNHSLAPEQNLRNWSEDARLEELVDGMRQVYYPPAQPVSRGDGEGSKPLNEMNEAEFMRFVDARRPGDDMAFKKQLLELHKANAPALMRTPEPPVVKIVCACRVHAAHFNLVTGNEGDTVAIGGPGPVPAQPAAADPASSEANAESRPPIQEGEPFCGFTTQDFRNGGVKKFYDPEVGSGRVARTPFADKNHILVALEIHSLDPKRDQLDPRA